MKQPADNPEKLYYSIGEVAAMFDVNESLLRFWEKEFDQLAPRKTAKGTRCYSKTDIETVGLIYRMTKEQGMKLAAVRKQLKANKEGVLRTHEIVSRLKAVREALTALRDELE